MLEISYQNRPELWDQEVVEPQSSIGAQKKHSYPTVPMYA